VQARFVSLRGKKLTSGNVALYLNRQENGKHIKRYLDKSILSIETDENVKVRNQETIKRARTIADEALEESGNKHGYYYTLQVLAKHISLYSGKNAKLQQVDKDYILGFISYLKIAKNFNYKRTGLKR